MSSGLNLRSTTQSRKVEGQKQKANDPVTNAIISTYKKVCRSVKEQKRCEVDTAWGQNKEKLERNLQSHQSFVHLHNASQAIRSRREQQQRNGKFWYCSEDPGFGAMASSKVFTSSKITSNPNGSSTSSTKKISYRVKGKGGKKRGRDREDGEVDVQKCRVRLTQSLEKIPYMVTWTAVPFNTAEEDGKFLTNIPFLGDEIIDKDRKFIDDILNLYKGNLYDPSSKGTVASVEKNKNKARTLEDEILIQLVDSLERTEIIASGMPMEEKTHDSNKTDIFDAISKTFKGTGTSDELKERYQNVLVKKQEPPRKILDSGVLGQDPASYTIPNIDGPYAKELPRENTMHAFQCLFCRRCYQYDCPRGHNGDEQVDLKHCKKTRNRQTVTVQYECENQDCWKKQTPQFLTDCEENWTPADISMFRALVHSFPDPCYIAKLMLTKNCKQVWAFSKKNETTPSETSESPTPPEELDVKPPISRANGNNANGTTTTNKKKSKKSSSVSKKNLSRRWINSLKKNVMIAEGHGERERVPLPPRFMPCQHHKQGGECDEKNPDCYCAKNGTSCEKFCSCPPTCKNRFPGCRCTSTCDSRRCVCFTAARECDPDLCNSCGASERDVSKINCRNVNIQKRQHKHLLMGRSDVSGWGIFIKEDAQKGDFIAEYRGEIISHDESERRGHVYDKLQHTFLFELNDHFVLDATRKGNKARFVNSSKTPNCEVKRMLVNGDHRIGIYAKRAIDAGEECFYDYENVLEKQQGAAVKHLASESTP